MQPSPRVPDQPGPPSPAGLRLYHKRAICSKLAPLLGLRASGVALVRATAGAVTLPAGSYAAPIIASTVSQQSQIDYSRLVKVGELPDWTAPSTRANAPADVVIDPVADPGGTLVPIYAMLGGSMYNATALNGLAAGTKLQWSPRIAGIEPVSVVSTGLTGGTDSTLEGALRRLVLFDRLGLGNLSLKGATPAELSAWRAKIGDYPAGVLILMGTRKAESGGRSRPIHYLKWRLLILTSSVGPTEERVQDADAILDHAGGLLENSGEVDGQAFSLPRIELGDTNLLVAEDALSIHHLDFTTCATFDRIESRVFASWLASDYQLLTTPTAEYPDPADALTPVDVEANQ